MELYLEWLEEERRAEADAMRKAHSSPKK